MNLGTAKFSNFYNCRSVCVVTYHALSDRTIPYSLCGIIFPHCFFSAGKNEIMKLFLTSSNGVNGFITNEKTSNFLHNRVMNVNSTSRWIQLPRLQLKNLTIYLLLLLSEPFFSLMVAQKVYFHMKQRKFSIFSRTQLNLFASKISHST